MMEQMLTPGSYLHELIAEESRAVAIRHNAAGYIAMWPKAIKKVTERFPGLSAGERAALRGTVEAQIQTLCTRTNIDIHQFSGARASVAMILGGAK